MKVTFLLSSVECLHGFSGDSDGKESTCNVGDLSLIPRLGRSPGEGNTYSLQYSGLGNSMDRGAWQATVQGVTESQTWLSNFHFSFFWWGELKSGMTYVVILIMSPRTKSLSWNLLFPCCCSVAQSCLTLQPHGLQHTRPPCPSLSPDICSDSCPLNWWCLTCRIFEY